ncbi:TetR family transcriptional regulator [Cryobacterium sp. PH31-O1]|nr:TetR family transcriptional regulator [Cryobacterium sp. PH31-O1]MDJ0337148.1 TetR family transcriptional regulator [Cryobacterium sp. PH31-O1]
MGGKIVIDGSSWIPVSTIIRAYVNPTVVRLASVEGIGGLSIARLAEAEGMSKSVLFGYFGFKRELQLATVEEADALFAAQVIESSSTASTALERLRGW